MSLPKCRQIPIPCYPSIAHPLSSKQLQALKHPLWTALARQGGISTNLSPKDHHQPKSRLGLNIRDLTPAIHKSTVASGIRFPNEEDPDIPCCVIQQALLSPEPNWFLDSFRDSCKALGLEYNGLPCSPAPYDFRIPHDHLYVK